MSLYTDFLRPEYYLFSNMYDDSLITDFYSKLVTESYDKAIQYQQDAISRGSYKPDNGNFMYSGLIKDFVIDEKYNGEHGLNVGSRTYTFKNFIVPVYNRLKFIRKYGMSNQRIPQMDFYTENSIFDKAVTLQINKYQFICAYFIVNIDHTVTVAINNSTTDGIAKDQFDRIIAEVEAEGKLWSEYFWVFTEEQSQLYRLISSIEPLQSVDPSDPDNYVITIPKSSNVTRFNYINEHKMINSWECYISKSRLTHGTQALTSYPCTLKATTSDSVQFSVNKTFLDSITDNTQVLLEFMHKPNRRNILTCSYTAETSPIISIDFENNPHGNINIAVYELDATTNQKGRRLYRKDFVQIIFPNILDFTPLIGDNWAGGSLLVEVTEYDERYTRQKMRNSIKPFIDSIGLDNYTQFALASPEADAINLVDYETKKGIYNPSSVAISYDDYKNSDFYGDIRGYMISKIDEFIMKDPAIYEDYLNWMWNIDPPVVSKMGTPKSLMFNTNGEGEFTGTNRVVRDTSIASMNPEDITYFDEDHSYITYHGEGDDIPAILWIDGKYVKVSAKRYYKGLNYLFYPVSEMVQRLQRFNEEELKEYQPITVDIYPNTWNSKEEAPSDHISITSTSQEIKLFNHIQNPVMTLAELVMVNDATGEFINIYENFDIIMDVVEYEVKNSKGTEKIIASKSTDIEYLLTSLGELYETKDEKPILLSQRTVEVKFNNLLENIYSDEKSGIGNKRINYRDLKFVPKSVSLIGASITVYSQAFLQEWRHIITEEDAGDNEYATSATFKGAAVGYTDPMGSPSHYLLFLNGKMVTSNQNIRFWNIPYGGDIEIHYYYPGKVGDELTLVHLPRRYSMVNAGRCKGYYDYDEETWTDVLTAYMSPATITQEILDAMPTDDKILKKIYPKRSDLECGLIWDCPSAITYTPERISRIPGNVSNIADAGGYRLPKVVSMHDLHYTYMDSTTAKLRPNLLDSDFSHDRVSNSYWHIPTSDPVLFNFQDTHDLDNCVLHNIITELQQY